MKQKYVNVSLGILVMILIVAIGYFALQKQPPVPTGQVLTPVSTSNQVSGNSSPAISGTSYGVSIPGTSFKQGDKVNISWTNESGYDGLILWNANGARQNNIIDAVLGNSYTWTIPSSIQPGSYYISAGNLDSKVRSRAFTVSVSNSVKPVINSVTPNPVTIGHAITVKASNLDPLGGWVRKEWIGEQHTQLYIQDGNGRYQILWAGNEPDNPKTQVTDTITVTIPSGQPCVYASGIGGCAQGAFVITPGQYTLYINVDGRGLSNSISIVIQ